MDALQQFSEQLQQVRSSLTPSQLKKLRKKRAKLSHQVAQGQLGGAGSGEPSAGDAPHPAAKRARHAPPAAASPAEAADSLPSLQHTEQHSAHDPSGECATPGQEAVSARAPLPSRAAEPRRPPRPPPAARPAGTADAPARQLSLQRTLQHQAAAAGGDAALPSTSTSTGPCRSDLSGHLVIIQQELSSSWHGHAADTPGEDDDDDDDGAGAHCTSSLDDSSTCSQQQQQQQPPPPPPPRPAAPGRSGGAHEPAAAAGSGQQQQQQSRKRTRPSCQYGNYHHYYGYRLKPAGFEDPRLKVLDPSWFKGADVLDVGCNEGLVTLALALQCGCRSVLGVDIDPALVAKACTNLSRSRTELNQQMQAAIRERNALGGRPWRVQQQDEQQQPAAPSGPLDVIAGAAGMRAPAARSNGGSSSSASTVARPGAAAQPSAGDARNGSSNGSSAAAEPPGQATTPAAAGAAAAAAAAAGGGGPGAAAQPLSPLQQQQQQQQQQLVLSPAARVVAAQRSIRSLSRVSFRAGNWLELPCASHKYEVITCFSVTKWVQLNWGDDGIMQLFHKFFRCLVPGGLLVLEPQPFKSYKSAVHKPGVQAAPFVDLSRLKLRPEAYADFLVQRVGFEMVQQLGSVSEALHGEAATPVKGFDRPIMVLRKPRGGSGGGGGGGGDGQDAAAAAAERGVAGG